MKIQFELNPTRLLEAIGLTTKTQAEQTASRAYEGGYYDGMNGNDEPPSGDLRSFGYRRQTTNNLRDFTRMNQDQLLSVAWILYQSNPMAGRYLEIVRDHVLGSGITYQVEDEALGEIIDTFWERNKLGQRLKKFTIQLRLFGEQCYPVFVRKSDGQVTLGYIDPGEIEQVVVHPDNTLEAYAVVLKADTRRGKRVYRIIRKDEGYVLGNRVITPNIPDKLVTHEQARLEPWESALLSQCGLTQYTGSCFYFSVNNVSNQPRGFSDLLSKADWLDAGDETLFALADREQMAGYFSWKVKLTGVDEPEVKRKASEIRARVPKKGQALVHNDKEEWSMEAPDLKQQASIATYDALSDLAWGMLGMPKPWKGIGEGSNYASANVMGEPTRKTLENKQDVIKDMVTDFLCFVRDQAEIAGEWLGSEANFSLQMPEMVTKDLAALSTTLSQLVSALSVATQDLKVITRETAAMAVARIMAEIGVEYDVNEELEKVDKEAEEQEEQDALPTANAANKFLQQQIMKQVANGNGNGNGSGPIPPDDMEGEE